VDAEQPAVGLLSDAAVGPAAGARGIGVAPAASPLSRGLLEIAILLLGLMVLQAARSRLAPCLSAAMFPVVFGIPAGWSLSLSP
jgi:hypothetical protein